MQATSINLMNIKKQLLDDLQSQDFSHLMMAKLKKSCADWLIESRGKSVDNNTKVLIHSILYLCYEVKERLDAIAPVIPAIHDKIEQAVFTPLKNAINIIENGSAQEHMDVIAKLIDADVEMRKLSKSV